MVHRLNGGRQFTDTASDLCDFDVSEFGAWVGFKNCWTWGSGCTRGRVAARVKILYPRRIGSHPALGGAVTSGIE